MTFKARKGIEVGAGKFLVNEQGDVTARVVNQIVNVKSFGAKGDSVTDDSNAVSLAAEHCIQNGGILFFPRGDYRHPTYTIPDTIACLYETGELIQSNRATFKFGTKQPLTNMKKGHAYFDTTTNALMVYDGTAWVQFARKNGSETINGNLTVTGDLLVQGDNVILNTTQLEIEDNIITLNRGVTGSPTLDSGIEVQRGTAPKAKVIFDETEDVWKLDNGNGVLSRISHGGAVNVKDFGAKGDGVTDDTAAIQRAIDFAVLSKQSIFIPSGTFIVSDKLSKGYALLISKAEKIKIYGERTSTFKSSDTTGDLIRVEESGSVNVSGISFVGVSSGGVNLDAGAVGLSFVKSSKNIVVESCVFENWSDTAVRVTSATPPPDASGLGISDVVRMNTIITNCQFSNNEHCLITKYGGLRNLVVTNNIVHKGAFGFKLDGETFSSYTPWTWKDYPTLSGNAVFSNNVFSELDSANYTSSWGLGAIVLEENVENVLVTGNVMADFKNVAGVTVNGGQGDRLFRNITISGNKFSNFDTGIGVTIQGGAGRDVSDIDVSGNDFNGFNACAVRIESKKGLFRTSVKNNRFIDVCQNTAFLGGLIPTDIGVYVVNKTKNTFYARDVEITENLFTFKDPSTFSESKPSVVIEGFLTAIHEDLVFSGNTVKRPYSTTVSPNGITVSDVSKVLFKNNYFENGRSYFKNVDLDFKLTKFYGMRLSFSGSTRTTYLNLNNCEAVYNGNGLTEFLKVSDNVQTVLFETDLSPELSISALTGSVITENNKRLLKQASLPTASASQRGRMVRIEGSAGVADSVYVCVKKADDSYDWAQLF